MTDTDSSSSSSSSSNSGFFLDDQPWSSQWQLASNVFVALTLTHFVAGTAWFLMRRKKYPINGHSISLVLGCAVRN